MSNKSKAEIDKCLKVLYSTIENCQKMQPKFRIDTPQHTLLENRIKALDISIKLLTKEKVNENYTKEELLKALDPIISIINKCKKAQEKFMNNINYQKRLSDIISTMEISKEYITEEIEKRNFR